jgi:hypothetical protein
MSGFPVIIMVKASTIKNKVICSIALLSLTLLLGFISPPSLHCNQERQSASTPKELVSRVSSSQKRIIRYPVFKEKFQLLLFISCREIITRLELFDRKVKVELTNNLISDELANRLKIELLSSTISNSKLSDSYSLRG